MTMNTTGVYSYYSVYAEESCHLRIMGKFDEAWEARQYVTRYLKNATMPVNLIIVEEWTNNKWLPSGDDDS